MPLFRRLVETDPVVHRPPLANALGARGSALSVAGRDEEAARSFAEGARLIGMPAIRRVRAMLEEQGVSQSAVVALQSVVSETNGLVKRAKQLTAGLAPMLESLPEPQLAPTEGCLWLFFEHETAMSASGTVAAIKRAPSASASMPSPNPWYAMST